MPAIKTKTIKNNKKRTFRILDTNVSVPTEESTEELTTHLKKLINEVNHIYILFHVNNFILVHK